MNFQQEKYTGTKNPEQTARKIFSMRQQGKKWKEIAKEIGHSSRYAMYLYFEHYSNEDRDMVRRLTTYHNGLVKTLVYHLYDIGYSQAKVAEVLNASEEAVRLQFPKKLRKEKSTLKGGE